MINQDECKASHRKRNSLVAFNGIPLYSNAGTCRLIQAVAETMIQEQLSLADTYASVRFSETQWFVGYSAERTISTCDVSPKPMFARIRTVTLNKSGELCCSCGYTERNGVPDRHLMHVAINYGISFEGFTHHQVAVRFWRAFDKFVVVGELLEMDSIHLGIRNKLWQAKCHQSTGTYIPGGFSPYQHAVEFVAGRKLTAKFHCMDAAEGWHIFIVILMWWLSITVAQWWTLLLLPWQSIPPLDCHKKCTMQMTKMNLTSRDTTTHPNPRFLTSAGRTMHPFQHGNPMLH